MEIVFSLDEINKAARIFFDYIEKNNSKIIAFYGQMGSGKTTFIKALCKILNVKDNVVSPTFAIINEYATDNGGFVYHFDFYRINKLQEALDIGVQDYFYSGNYCFMEWPEIVEPLLPENTLKVNIEELPDGKRKLTV